MCNHHAMDAQLAAAGNWTGRSSPRCGNHFPPTHMTLCPASKCVHSPVNVFVCTHRFPTFTITFNILWHLYVYNRTKVVLLTSVVMVAGWTSAGVSSGFLKAWNMQRGSSATTSEIEPSSSGSSWVNIPVIFLWTSLLSSSGWRPRVLAAMTDLGLSNQSISEPL